MRSILRAFPSAAAFFVVSASMVWAQFGNQPAGNAPQQENFQNQNAVFGNGPRDNSGSQFGVGNSGGGANADFDSLIELIQSTVAQETWAENGGGEAEIRPFPTGVMVDAAGTLALVKASAPAPELAQRRGSAPSTSATTSDADAREASPLRYVSLPRLEREIIRRQDNHLALDPAMLALAGLRCVEYVFVYHSSENDGPGDLVLAGPAGGWQVAPFGRLVAVDTGEPIMRLDDLLTLLRRARQSQSSFFGCAINPRQESLAATQAYLDKTSTRPIQPGRRDAWLERIRTTLGRQDVEIFGIDPTSRVARVLVEADIHMKLVGMGLEDGIPGVESYLDSVKASGQPPAAMSVLRWWFALHYAAIRTSPANAAGEVDAYELVGDGVGVLSENEMLAARGQRVHTGQSDPLNAQFATSFTDHYPALAEKYPIYGELRSIFDLALAVALIQTDKLCERIAWQPTRLVDNEKLRLPHWPTPREVDTVANCVVTKDRTIIAGVSGGVMVDTAATLANRTATSAAALTKIRTPVPSTSDPDGESIRWWWDAPKRN